MRSTNLLNLDLTEDCIAAAAVPATTPLELNPTALSTVVAPAS